MFSNIEPLKRSRFADARFGVERYTCDPYTKGSSPLPGYYWVYNVVPGPVMAHLYELLHSKPLCVSYMGTRTTLKMLWMKYPTALLFPIPLPDMTRITQFKDLPDPNIDSEAITHLMKHE